MRPLAALLLLALPAAAADVDLKPVYLQPLSHFQVTLDRQGKAWFVDTDGVRDADNKVICKELKGKLLLVDAAGRCWFREEYDAKKTLHFFDGKDWTDTGVAGHEVYEDAAGRVIARTPAGFAVFDGKGWKEDTPFEQPASGTGVFVEDDRKRVWYHLHKTAGLGQGDDGVWAFDGKGWKHHAPGGRAKDEHVTDFIPFADDWFLVLVRSDAKGAKNAHWPRAFAWSPGRTADEIAKAEPFAGLPADHLEYRGTDRDGVSYFRWLGEGAPEWQKAPDYPPGYAVGPKGEVRKLARAEGERIARQPYRMYRGRRLIHAAPDDPLPAVPFDLSRAVGTDADGRVYVQASGPEYAASTWVLWPKHEKAGECVRPAAYPPVGDGPRAQPAVYQDLFTDSAGTAFARPREQADAVVVWDAKAEKWAETPIKPLPQAHWYARPAPPPEYRWANLRAVGHVCGTDGLSLFVRVKTKYAPEKVGEPFKGRGDPLPKVEEDAPFYVYEAWLHAGGKWSEGVGPADLLKVKRKDLVAEFGVPATPFGPLPVIALGDRLWFAQDWKVTTVDAGGVTKSVDLPRPKTEPPPGPRGKATPPLMQGAFARLDDKTLVLAVAAGKQTQTYTVRFQGGKFSMVRAEEVGALPLLVPTLHAAPDGTVLAWDANGSGVFHLKDDKWEAVADVGRVLAVAGDGAVWCHPLKPGDDPDWKKGARVLYRLLGGKAERFAWTADEWAVGFEKPAKGSALFLLSGAGLACLEPSQPGAKPVLRVRYAPPPESAGHPGSPVVSSSGHLLLAAESARLFDPKGK